MSLTKASFLTVVKKQYFYKLNAYLQVYLYLMILQISAIIFTFSGIGSSIANTPIVAGKVRYYSADIVVVITMLWGFITGMLVSYKAYRYDDFTFVTNRLSSNASNMLFLLTVSIIGGFTAMLASSFIKDIMHYFENDFYVTTKPLMDAPIDLIIGVVAAALYVLLFCACGYLFGTFLQIHQSFVVVIPAFITLVLSRLWSSHSVLLTEVYGFFFHENSLLLFFIKILVVVSLLFSGAAGLTNKMEVNA